MRLMSGRLILCMKMVNISGERNETIFHTLSLDCRNLEEILSYPVMEERKCTLIGLYSTVATIRVVVEVFHVKNVF